MTFGEVKQISKFKDITGKRFGRLVALHRLHNTKGKTKWLCICDCGNFKEVYYESLRAGFTNSCGCLQKEVTSERFTTHGKSKTLIYNVYRGMLDRCYNKHVKRYENYGGRGIKVCDEWYNNFQSFYTWAMNNGYKNGLSIDRINNDGDYEPSNCRWTNNKTQARNRRSNRNITINGETRCLMEWCEILNLNYKVTWQRINTYHWSIKKALELE